MRGTLPWMIAVDHVLGGSPGSRDLDADLVHTPASDLLRIALYPLELARLVVAFRYKLRGSARTKSTRPSHGCLRQLLASCQFSSNAPKTTGCLAATLAGRLTLEVILAGRCSVRTYVLLVEGWAST